MKNWIQKLFGSRCNVVDVRAVLPSDLDRAKRVLAENRARTEIMEAFGTLLDYHVNAAHSQANFADASDAEMRFHLGGANHVAQVKRALVAALAEEKR